MFRVHMPIIRSIRCWVAAYGFLHWVFGWVVVLRATVWVLFMVLMVPCCTKLAFHIISYTGISVLNQAPCIKAYETVEVWLHPFWSLVLDDGEWWAWCLSCFPSGKWATVPTEQDDGFCPKDSVDNSRKNLFLFPGIKPRYFKNRARNLALLWLCYIKEI